MIDPKDIDLESLYAHSRNNKLKVIQGWISSYIGDILMNLDDSHQSEAQTWIQKAIEEDQRNGMRFIWEETTPFTLNGSNETAIAPRPGKTWVGP